MPKSEEYLARAIYTKLSGVAVDTRGTKSVEYWAGLIYDAMYGTHHYPNGGHKSTYYWLKLMRPQILATYGVDVLGHKSLASIMTTLLSKLG